MWSMRNQKIDVMVTREKLANKFKELSELQFSTLRLTCLSMILKADPFSCNITQFIAITKVPKRNDLFFGLEKSNTCSLHTLSDTDYNSK